MYPTDLRYTNDHEWVRRGSDGTLTVGITSFAARQLGDVVFVELQQTGTAIEASTEFGTIESVKAVAEVFMPVSGTITATNEELDGSPELVNDDCYGDGWLIKVRPSNASEYDQLMTAEAYGRLVSEEDG
jgi:glycine cleavage system H protein